MRRWRALGGLQSCRVIVCGVSVLLMPSAHGMPLPYGMIEAILLLEVGGSPGALARLEAQVGRLIEGPRAIAVLLADQTPEEVLSACATAGVEVQRSRVVRTVSRERWAVSREP